MKGSRLFLAKRGSDGITFYFVVMRTKVIPSYSLIHMEGGMESTGSESFSL